MSSFDDEQATLRARLAEGRAKAVCLDADGTNGSWLLAVVKAPTGSVYEQQCAGVACETRYVEGYVVLLGGLWSDSDQERIDPAVLTKPFHADGCAWTWTGSRLPSDRLEALGRLVERIPFWHRTPEGEDRRGGMKLDRARLEEELAEAWIPVLTPDGPGVLLYPNCD